MQDSVPGDLWKLKNRQLARNSAEGRADRGYFSVKEHNGNHAGNDQTYQRPRNLRQHSRGKQNKRKANTRNNDTVNIQRRNAQHDLLHIKKKILVPFYSFQSEKIGNLAGK